MAHKCPFSVGDVVWISRKDTFIGKAEVVSMDWVSHKHKWLLTVDCWHEDGEEPAITRIVVYEDECSDMSFF